MTPLWTYAKRKALSLSGWIVSVRQQQISYKKHAASKTTTKTKVAHMLSTYKLLREVLRFELFLKGHTITPPVFHFVE